MDADLWEQLSAAAPSTDPRTRALQEEAESLQAALEAALAAQEQAAEAEKSRDAVVAAAEAAVARAGGRMGAWHNGGLFKSSRGASVAEPDRSLSEVEASLRVARRKVRRLGGTGLGAAETGPLPAELLPEEEEEEEEETHGFGAALPLKDNATDDGRARNRRVQFLVMPDV